LRFERGNVAVLLQGFDIRIGIHKKRICMDWGLRKDYGQPDYRIPLFRYTD
jgi:hypothetical protein